MAEADELITWLGFKFKPDARRNINDAQKAVDTLKNGVRKLNDFFFGAGGAINYFKNQLMGGAQTLENLSKVTGMSMNSLQKWKYAAQASGVSFEALVGNLQEFKKTGQDVMTLSARLSGMSSKTALQMKDYLGLSDDMYILLRKGPKEIQDLLDSAPTLSEKDLKKTIEANKELAKVTAKIDNIKTEIMTKFAPMILKILEGINNFLDKNGSWLKDNLKPIVDGLLLLFVGGKLLSGANAVVSVLKGGVGLLTMLTSAKAGAAGASAASSAGASAASSAGTAAASGIGKGLLATGANYAGIAGGAYAGYQGYQAVSSAMEGNWEDAAGRGAKVFTTGIFSALGAALAGPTGAKIGLGVGAAISEGAEWLGGIIGGAIYDNFFDKGLSPEEIAKMTPEEILRYNRQRYGSNTTNNTNTVTIQVANAEQAAQIGKELSGGQLYTPVEPGSFGGNVQA